MFSFTDDIARNLAVLVAQSEAVNSSSTY